VPPIRRKIVDEFEAELELNVEVLCCSKNAGSQDGNTALDGAIELDAT
jgi:hypothetical protein